MRNFILTAALVLAGAAGASAQRGRVLNDSPLVNGERVYRATEGNAGAQGFLGLFGVAGLVLAFCFFRETIDPAETPERGKRARKREGS